jgi:hypothetical protein
MLWSGYAEVKFSSTVFATWMDVAFSVWVFLLPSVSAIAARDVVPMTVPLLVTISGSTPSPSIFSSASLTKADFAIVIGFAITSLTSN